MMKKKIRARLYIVGYEDPVTGLNFDIKYDGDNDEIIALLFKSAVTVCKKARYMSNEQIIDLFTKCVMMLGDQHD